MNDLLSVARRLRGYADEPGASRQKQQDLLIAVDLFMAVNAIMSATAPTDNRKDSPIPG